MTLGVSDREYRITGETALRRLLRGVILAAYEPMESIGRRGPNLAIFRVSPAFCRCGHFSVQLVFTFSSTAPDGNRQNGGRPHHSTIGKPKHHEIASHKLAAIPVLALVLSPLFNRGAAIDSDPGGTRVGAESVRSVPQKRIFCWN
jgi:hypothetical protein